MSSSTPAFPPETTVGALVAAQPILARVFAQLHIDYCCGGKVPLAEACAARGLALSTVTAMLADAAAAFAGPADDVDPANLSLGELADHIEQRHHAYVKDELPRLLEMAERVARKHGWRDERLAEVAGAVQTLTQDMFAHMHKEETVLFPLVRRLEAGARNDFHCGSIANPIRQMEAEHDEAGATVARLRELTDGFTPDAEACNTHRALLAGLAQFEADLHRHVHKENNLLFPRALACATGT